MAIKVEVITHNGKVFRKTTSDSGYYIKKQGTNEIYSEAVDVLTATNVYVETTTKIEEQETAKEA